MKKANEQLKLYKELYDPNKSSNTLMSVASEEDKESLKELFNRYENMDQDDINNQIESIKSIEAIN